MSIVIEAKPLPKAEPSLPKGEPCVIVIFGALGDLTQRKLMPALFYLARAGCLSSHFKVLGIAREAISEDEFRERMQEGAKDSKEMGEFSDAEWQSFALCLRYLSGDLNQIETYS